MTSLVPESIGKCHSFRSTGHAASAAAAASTAAVAATVSHRERRACRVSLEGAPGPVIRLADE